MIKVFDFIMLVLGFNWFIYHTKLDILNIFIANGIL